MSPQEFQENLTTELQGINVTLLDLYSRSSALCLKWQFENERPFTSCFVVNNEYLMTFPQECIEVMMKEVLTSLTEPDNLVGRVTQIKRSRKRAA